jgi:hypothetical protein
MEQRLLRLGDIVDDYCPRDRRITNHAVVAIVANVIRQTRCTTCDYEHGFKQAREPRRRTKPVESLFAQVLTDVAGAQLVGPRLTDDEAAPPPDAAMAIAAEDLPDDDGAPAPRLPDEGWPAHRTLIRATLPKTDGEPPPARPIPEFTMHQKPQPVRGRGGFRRLVYGPQGDPFGGGNDQRPARGGHPGGRGHGNGNGNGSGPVNGNGNSEPGERRGRRRRGGKRGR